MKLAISATGKDLDSMIDPSFGRANYFVIVDAKSGDIVKVIDNSAAQDAAGGAGINAATIVWIRCSDGPDRPSRAKCLRSPPGRWDQSDIKCERNSGRSCRAI